MFLFTKRICGTSLMLYALGSLATEISHDASPLKCSSLLLRFGSDLSDRPMSELIPQKLGTYGIDIKKLGYVFGESRNSIDGRYNGEQLSVIYGGWKILRMHWSKSNFKDDVAPTTTFALPPRLERKWIGTSAYLVGAAMLYKKLGRRMSSDSNNRMTRKSFDLWLRLVDKGVAEKFGTGYAIRKDFLERNADSILEFAKGLEHSNLEH